MLKVDVNLIIVHNRENTRKGVIDMQLEKNETIFMTAEECNISQTAAYRLIKELNVELASLKKLVQNGKIQRAFFHSKIYGYKNEQADNKSLFINVKDISNQCGICVNTLYPKIKEANDALKKEGYLVLPGKLPIAYFNERWLYTPESTRT